MTDTGRKRRGHSRFVFFFILILIALGCLSWFGYRGLCNADWLQIKNIRISGNENISASTLQALLQEYQDCNLVALSSSDVRKQLSRIARIDRVTIFKLYPSTLKVKITEKKGFLYLKSREGDLFPADNRLMVMENAVCPSREDLPVVHTDLASRKFQVGKIIRTPFLVKVIALHRKIMNESPDFVQLVSEYYEQNGFVMIIDAKFGTRVLVGEQDLKDQLRRYLFVQENGDINRSGIIDLRYKDQVVVRQEL
jgi:cell division septal protein FtsQ